MSFTKKATVTLAVRSDQDGNLEISVSAPGPGFPDGYCKGLEEMQTYGSPFGAGAECLGVAASWAMVRKHKGKMEIESETNAGTKIAFMLPIEENRPSFEIVREHPDTNEVFCVYRSGGRCEGSFSTWQEAVECKEKMEKDVETVVYPDDDETKLL